MQLHCVIYNIRSNHADATLLLLPSLSPTLPLVPFRQGDVPARVHVHSVVHVVPEAVDPVHIAVLAGVVADLAINYLTRAAPHTISILQWRDGSASLPLSNFHS
jgi:hypothetical protein